MKSLKFMVFDVESVGLYGEGFAYGYVIVNDNGVTLQKRAAMCDPKNAKGTMGDRKWIHENVVPALKSKKFEMARHPNPKEVRKDFWECWIRAYYKYPGIMLVADCPYPVEVNFILKGLQEDKSRKEYAPYPFIDVASVLLGQGIAPLAHHGRKIAEKPVHHPLADAKQSARLLIDQLKANPVARDQLRVHHMGNRK